MKTVLILTALATSYVAMAASPASAACVMSYCKDRETTMAPGEKLAITNTHRQRLGDLYSPGGGRRTQIRDKHRRIIGYIERTGKITDKRRRKVGKIEKLLQ